jgi:hypothetical protein
MAYKSIMISVGLWILIFMSTTALAAPFLATEPGRNPYQEDDSTNTQFIVGNATLGLEMPPVPEGKRLVVKHVSVVVESGDPDLEVNCLTFGGYAEGSFGRVTPSHRLLLGPQFTMFSSPGRPYGHVAPQPITLYIDSGLAPEIGCVFSRALSVSDNVFMQGTVSGYLIDLE